MLQWNSKDNVFHLETKYKYENQDKYIHLIFGDSCIKHCSGKIYKLATFLQYAQMNFKPIYVMFADYSHRESESIAY